MVPDCDVVAASILAPLAGVVGGVLMRLDDVTFLNTIFGPPQQIAVRVGLSALVLLAAITLGPRFAAQVSAVPVRVETVLGRDGRHRAAEVVEERGGLGAWLGRITVASIWIAAAAGLVLIWLWGQPGFVPQDPYQVFRTIGYVVTRIGISLIVLALTLVLGGILEKGVERSLKRRVNPNLLLLAGRAVYIGTLATGLVVILAVWGTGVVIPVALLGVLTVALSVALQDILKNLVAGVYLLFERPFVIGDKIAVSAYSGAVEDIHLRVTWLRTPDGRLVLVPNALLFTSPVVNLSAYERRRASLAVSLPDTGPDGMDAAESRILAVLESIPGIRTDPAPEVRLSGASAGRLELRANFWVPTRDHRQEEAIISDAIEQLRVRLPHAKIAPLDTTAAART
jgi:small-conductance mechanosensitive channel